ncbi:MAG: P-II family nitrogen regulator [Planctomycetota bacterium]
MHMIEAVINTDKLDAVKAALAQMNVLGLTVVDAKGYGRQLGHKETYRGATVESSFNTKSFIKVCVKAEDSDNAVNAIATAARTGNVGDGKIFIYPVAKVVRIRTGETDADAL